VGVGDREVVRDLAEEVSDDALLVELLELRFLCNTCPHQHPDQNAPRNLMD
jgi:hypothetical protein